ncbi:hypothetical protein [Massilia sp. GCM10023247]|uniref:hypothetical protein n=1 Tax=Massilia sp. GCM10023247 TaxID=3252643 RepID=UPI003606DFE4
MFDFGQFTQGYIDGESYGVNADVSRGDAPMQPTTATGNGYGYHVDNGWLNALGGTVQTALNYALLRDQQKMAQQTGYVSVQTPLTPTPQVQAQMQNSRLLVLGLIGVGIAFAMRGGK